MDDSSEALNSLEDWIAIKEGLFADDNTSQRPLFLVAFNHIENAVAITCRFGHRRARDKHNQSMATSISLLKLIDFHRELSYVRPELNQHFEAIERLIQRRDTNSRFYSYIFGIRGDGYIGHDVNEELCNQVKQYLDTSVSLCGRKLVFTLLFDVDFLADFEENIHELRRKGFENLLNNALEELNEVINLRSKTETLLEMTTIYAIEDQVIANASIALAELYNFQLQPFLKLREIASESMKSAQRVINDCDLGQRIKDKALINLKEAKDQFLSSTEALQQLYHEYYYKTVELVAAQTERMRSDRKRFGESAFQVKGGLIRLQRLELFLTQERLKLLNSIKTTKEFQKSQIKQQLSDKSLNYETIEIELFEMEINVLDSKLEIIDEEEKLIKQTIVILETENKQNDGFQEFFDAIGDEKELEQMEDTNETDSSKVCQKLSALKTKLNKLYRKRALLRNKKMSLHSTKSAKHINIIKEKQNFEKHHKIQVKRNNKPIVDNKSDEKFKEIRRKTLERLKRYKLKALTAEIDCDSICEDEECLPLPPYPQINYSESNQMNLPLPPPPPPPPQMDQFSGLPPPEVINEVIPVPPYPPPPPPPPLPPPSMSLIPPPPPPPPMLTIPKPFLNRQKSEKKELNSKSQSDSKNSSQIDLKDILEMRNKLKPTSVGSTKAESRQTSQDLLFKALNQIRNVTQDSDSSEDESEQDFNDD